MIEIYAMNLTRQLTEPVEKFLPLFLPNRREKILRQKFLADRNRTLWTELLARAVIAKKFSCTVEDVLLERDENGKPHVLGLDGRAR